jgi:enoyl-CoA hydratase
MADYENIIVETHGRVGLIRLNRPTALNALCDALMEELGAQLLAFDESPGIGAIVLTGNEKAFAAGADIKEMKDRTHPAAMLDDFIARRWETVLRVKKPVIAAVAGFALGGGCELAMACHIRIASDAAKFGQPESKLGILPGYGGSQRLPRLVGKGRAMQLLMTGETIDAAEAYRIGLVNRVVAAAELVSATKEMMKTILANGPLAIALCIEAIERGLEMSLDEGLILEANHFGLLAATDDMREGMRAFMEKRPPAFKGK